MGNFYIIILLKYVGVRKLQVAILARSPREMSQTDRIVWKHILSRVRVCVRPSICFIREKKTKPIAITESPACCLFQWITDGHCLASVESGAPNHEGMTESWLGARKQRTATVVGGVFVCASVCACMRAYMRACMMCLQYRIIIFYPG